MYKLDYSKTKIIQLSNDAFYYLREEDEPLDEANMEEAEEIIGLFPNGFIIEDDWSFIEGTDLIEAKFVPYVPEVVKPRPVSTIVCVSEDQDDYDMYFELAQGVILQLKYLSRDAIRVWWRDYNRNTREHYGDFKILVNKYGGKYFQKGPISTFYIKRFRKKVK